MDIIPKTPQKALTPHLQHAKQPGGFEKEDKASDDCSSCENTHFSPHCRKLEISSLNSFLGTYSLKIPVWERDFFFLRLDMVNFMEKEMATHSSMLAWKIPWTEEPGGLQSMGLQRVRHD